MDEQTFIILYKLVASMALVCPHEFANSVSCPFKLFSYLFGSAVNSCKHLLTNFVIRKFPTAYGHLLNS